jgi:hypothetical protein
MLRSILVFKLYVEPIPTNSICDEDLMSQSSKHVGFCCCFGVLNIFFVKYVILYKVQLCYSDKSSVFLDCTLLFTLLTHWSYFIVLLPCLPYLPCLYPLTILYKSSIFFPFTLSTYPAYTLTILCKSSVLSPATSLPCLPCSNIYHTF